MTEEERPSVLAFYAAARAEVVQRLALREQVLLASIAADGVVSGLAFRSVPSNYDVLLFIPWISLFFTMALGRHDFLIRQVGKCTSSVKAMPEVLKSTGATLGLSVNLGFRARAFTLA